MVLFVTAQVEGFDKSTKTSKDPSPINPLHDASIVTIESKVIKVALFTITLFSTIEHKLASITSTAYVFAVKLVNTFEF